MPREAGCALSQGMVLYKATPVSSQEVSIPKTIIFRLAVIESVIQ